MHDFEMDHVKKQLQAKMVERKELLAQLEAHHTTGTCGERQMIPTCMPRAYGQLKDRMIQTSLCK